MKTGLYVSDDPDICIVLRLLCDRTSKVVKASGDLQVVAAGKTDSFQTAGAAPIESSPDHFKANITFAGGENGVLSLSGNPGGGIELEIAISPTANAATQTYARALTWKQPEAREATLTLYIAPGVTPPDSQNLATVLDPLTNQAITLASALAENDIKITSNQTVDLPEPDQGDDGYWSDAELHDALADLTEAAVSGPSDPLPLRLMVTDHYLLPGVLGVMFDTGEENTGRSAAVFYDDLANFSKVRSSPEKLAREYIFTCTHEIGHLLNLPHAWEPFSGIGPPQRSDHALSFMQYPTEYYLGYSLFYRDFHFRFREEERAYIWNAPWKTFSPDGGESYHGVGTQLAILDHPHLRLELRTPGGDPQFMLGEPVLLEAVLKNTGDKKIRLPADLLNIEGGRLRVSIESAINHKSFTFEPIVHREIRKMTDLGPENSSDQSPAHGQYETLNLSYHRRGFPFAKPGTYKVSAVAHIGDGSVVTSDPLTIEIREPSTRQREVCAGVFLRDIGRALIFGADPRSATMRKLETFAEQTELPGLAALSAFRLGTAYARAFKRTDRKRRIKRDLKTAQAWLKKASKLADKHEVITNPLHSDLLVWRDYCESLIDEKTSHVAFGALRDFLRQAIPDNSRLRRKAEKRMRALHNRLHNLN